MKISMKSIRRRKLWTQIIPTDKIIIFRHFFLLGLAISKAKCVLSLTDTSLDQWTMTIFYGRNMYVHSFLQLDSANWLRDQPAVAWSFCYWLSFTYIYANVIGFCLIFMWLFKIKSVIAYTRIACKEMCNDGTRFLFWLVFLVCCDLA